MKIKSISTLTLCFLFASMAAAQQPLRSGAAGSAILEGRIPPGATAKEAILELADGSNQPITYFLTKDGKAILDGDILITVEEDGRARIAKEFDRLWSERNASDKAYMINGSSFRWSNNTVPFDINVGSTSQENTILDAMQHIEDLTAVRFVPRTNENDYVDFVNYAGVCRSYVGRQGGRQTIELDSYGCSFGTVVHEIGHALGLWHEHQRSDRDNSVIVHWNNIQTNPDARPNFQIRSGFWRGPFDFNSIMCYGSDFFSRNGLPTLTRLDGSTWQAQRNALTATDATGIGDMYKRVRASIVSDCIGYLNQCDFYASASHGVMPVTSWRWTIEDGNSVIIKTGGYARHQFQNPGPNYVFLEVIDSQGDRGTAQTIIDLSGCIGLDC